MKYLGHGIVISLLLIIFLWILVGASAMYYAVWCVILVAQIFMLVTGSDLTKMVKDDTAYLAELKDEFGELKLENFNDETANTIKSKAIKHLSIMVVAFGILFWQFLGLFTTNWFIFLSLFLFGFFIHLPITKMFKEKTVFIRWFNRFWGVMRTGILIFAIVNAFHYQMDTFQWLLGLFS